MDEKPFESMNVIPFVDIMLVLLTIVLTTSSFIATGRLAVNLPQASQTMPDQKEDHSIELGPNGTLSFDDKAVSLDGLKTELTGLKAGSTFVIRADRDIAFQRFVDVADLLRQFDFTKVAIQTETHR